jgi:hypothetical protein
MPLDIPMQSSGGDSGAADAFKPLVDALDMVGKFLSDETPLFKRQNQLLQQLVQINQRQLRTQSGASRMTSGGAGGVGKQTEAISKNITTQDTASSALKSFESIVSLTTSPLSRFAKTSGIASLANVASIASTGKATLSTNSLSSAFDQTIKPIEEMSKSFSNVGAGFTSSAGYFNSASAAMKSFTGQVNSFGVPTGTAAAAPSGTTAAAAPSGTTATATAAPPPDLDALQTEVNNLSADLYQAGVDLQATKFYLEQFQNNLANANKPMNVLTEAFNNIGDTGGVLTDNLSSLFSEVQTAFGTVDLREFHNKLFAAADAFAKQANMLSQAFDLDSMDQADLAFLQFTQRLTNATQPLGEAHDRLLSLAAVAGIAEANFDKADEAAKKLADQLKTAQEALAAAGGPPVSAPVSAPADVPADVPAGPDAMKEFTDELSADLKMLSNGIKEFSKAAFSKTKEAVKGAGDVAKSTFGAAAAPVETMKTGLGMAKNVSGTALKGAYGGAKAAVKGAGSALSTGISTGFSTALKGATGALGQLTGMFSMAGGPVTMLATTIATATIGNIVAFGAELTHGMDVMGGLTKATSFVGTYFGKLVNGALAPFAKGMNYASNALDRAAMAADLSGMAMRRQAELAKAAGEIQKTATASIMNAVKAPLTGLPDLIKQVASYVEVVDPAAAKLAQDSLRGFTAVIGKVLQPALGILVQGLNYVAGQLMSEKGFKGLSTAVAAIATMIVEKVKGIDFEAFIDDLLKSAATMIEALSNISSITMGLADMFNGLITIISTLWDGLSALASGVYTVIDFLVIAFMDGLKSVVNAFIAVARTFGSSIKYLELGDAVKSKFGEGPAKDKPEKPQAAAANLAALPVQNASFKGLADVGKEMQTRSFSAGVSLEKMQMEMAANINDLLKNPTASALFQAFKNIGGGFIAPDANAQGV